MPKLEQIHNHTHCQFLKIMGLNRPAVLIHICTCVNNSVIAWISCRSAEGLEQGDHRGSAVGLSDGGIEPPKTQDQTVEVPDDALRKLGGDGAEESVTLCRSSPKVESPPPAGTPGQMTGLRHTTGSCILTLWIVVADALKHHHREVNKYFRACYHYTQP